MTAPWLVVVPDRLVPPADVEQAVFGDRARVIALQAHTNHALVGHIEDADAILAWHDLSWNRDLLSSLRRCKVIVRVGVGYDNVDLDAAHERGIVICNVPDYGTNDVADHAIALLLSLARGLEGHNRLAHTGATGWKWGLVPTFRLTGKKLGIIGLGRIGVATALRAKAFGMNVGFFDPYKPDGWDKTLGLHRYDSLDALARDCDIVSLHAPLTAETRGMVDERFFRAVKPGVVLINTARGPIIDATAFAVAVRSGRVSCAGLDVLPVEPIDLADPLLAAWAAGDLGDRLLITPHCAFYSPQAIDEMRRKAAAEALRVLAGEAPRNRVG